MRSVVVRRILCAHCQGVRSGGASSATRCVFGGFQGADEHGMFIAFQATVSGVCVRWSGGEAYVVGEYAAVTASFGRLGGLWGENV